MKTVDQELNCCVHDMKYHRHQYRDLLSVLTATVLSVLSVCAKEMYIWPPLRASTFEDIICRISEIYFISKLISRSLQHFPSHPSFLVSRGASGVNLFPYVQFLLLT